MLENDLKLYYLQQLGIDCWVLREPCGDQAAQSSSGLQKLAYDVNSCTRCDLHQSRTQTVFSRGNQQAKLMIIGDAPADVEDRQGKPFVGEAGALLDKMLGSIGLVEKDVYIANVLKCRPPADRFPQPSEVEACRSFLIQQIQLVAPRLILALGELVGELLFGAPASLSQLRLVLHHYDKIPFIVTYHPDFLLRNPQQKKQAYLDLLFVKDALSR